MPRVCAPMRMGPFTRVASASRARAPRQRALPPRRAEYISFPNLMEEATVGAGFKAHGRTTGCTARVGPAGHHLRGPVAKSGLFAGVLSIVCRRYEIPIPPPGAARVSSPAGCKHVVPSEERRTARSPLIQMRESLQLAIRASAAAVARSRGCRRRPPLPPPRCAPSRGGSLLFLL